MDDMSPGDLYKNGSALSAFFALECLFDSWFKTIVMQDPTTLHTFAPNIKSRA